MDVFVITDTTQYDYSAVVAIAAANHKNALHEAGTLHETDMLYETETSLEAANYLEAEGSEAESHKKDTFATESGRDDGSEMI